MGTREMPPEPKGRKEVKERRDLRAEQESLFFYGERGAVDKGDGVITRAAIEISKDKSGPIKNTGSEFDADIRWKIQRAMEKYLEENPEFRSALYINSTTGKNIEEAKKAAIKGLITAYEKIISKEMAA